MLARFPVRWCVPAALLGFAAGLLIAGATWSKAVQARSEDRRAADDSTERAPALIEVSRQLAKVSAEITPSVVHIETKVETPGQGMVEETGSGVIIADPKVPGCYVVTNRHVVGDAAGYDQIAVRLSDGRNFHPSKRWIDRETDIALIKIETEGAKPIPWGNSDRLEIGNLVLAVGSPFGLRQSITMGIVSARGRTLHLGKEADLVNQDFIQTDAAINFGNSGGPLIDVNGRLIGINTAIASHSGGNDGIGFSIPSNLVRRVVTDLLERGQVQRAYLGVMLDPDFTADKARDLKLDRVRGAKIVRVYPGSPAARAGLVADDVILSFDGLDILDENHLINLVSLTAVGRKVNLSVWRGGRRSAIEVLLSDRHELNDQSNLPPRPGMGALVEPLGLALHELNDPLAVQLGLPPATRGLLVLRIDPKSPLSGSVDVYDVLQEVARRPVASVAEVNSALAVARGRGDVLLRFSRHSGAAQHSHVVLWRP